MSESNGIDWLSFLSSMNPAASADLGVESDATLNRNVSIVEDPLALPPPKRRGRKPVNNEPANKKIAMQRASAKAFRERREKYVENLESTVKHLQQVQRDSEAIRIRLEQLQRENELLKQVSFAYNSSMAIAFGTAPSELPNQPQASTAYQIPLDQLFSTSLPLVPEDHEFIDPHTAFVKRSLKSVVSLVFSESLVNEYCVLLKEYLMYCTKQAPLSIVIIVIRGCNRSKLRYWLCWKQRRKRD
ncbi:hypothetical protein BCR33DRAFT_852162 [Rhizoclosmatium globosum]|uniref:BZIP domain-containing protein n=1 Tax=Rhizoclosmatium globosum TaxID=329046 RepID=A0A1Y2C3Q2_9FUNG|nr:hypothetical protein BCR33DRAFT_852162 [Rhizoclosmatium globosum]|eukprot:ORY41659.1 hypothetical protein BCR33DRAFT_852162 [Rhizoclosmatium globosum]